MQKMRLALLLPLIALTGCSLLPKKEVVVNVIEEKDYKELEVNDKGEPRFVCLTPEKFGEIAKARLGK